MKKKSICFLLPGWITKNTGGSELQLYLLSEELVKRRWAVEVITNKPALTIRTIYLNANIKYHYYKHSKIKIIIYCRILLCLLKTRSNFYYVRTNATLLRGCARSYCKFFNKKLVYALAGDDELEFTQFKFDNNNNFIKNIIYWTDITIINFLIRNQYKDLDLIISQTNFQKQTLKEKYNLNSILIKNSTLPSDNKANVKENIILWVGNFRKVKQPELFIEIADQFKGSGWRFVMVGKQNNYFKNNDMLKISNVEMLGEIDYPKTRLWIQRAKVLINTSTSEGFSNTFIEAWIYNTLILSLSVDTDKLLSKMNYGIYCNNDIEYLSSMVKAIMDDQIQTEPFTESACQFAIVEFSLQQNAKRLEDTLLNSISNNIHE